MNGACTIVSPNYLSFARTLAQSYLRHHPGDVFFTLIVADVHAKDLFHDEPFKTVLMEELPLSHIKGLAMKYDILELNTNIKPTFMKYLFARHELDALTYLDPDIYVYSALTPILDMLGPYSIVLIPHLTSPLPDDGCSPCERDMLYNGTYNLGFIALRKSTDSLRMLDWWESRCLREAFSEGRSGLFVDQKWINLIPGMFDGIGICRDLGCNMAYWNLSERTLSWNGVQYLVNGTAVLRFFHFSGIDVDDHAMLSMNTDRFTLENRRDLAPVFSGYKAEILQSRNATKDRLPYGFDNFSDGSAVTRLQRRIFAAHETEFGEEDPFDSGGRFYDFLRRHRLLVGKLQGGRPGWRDFNPNDRRVRLVNRLLLIALRLLGPIRYELLMRYLSFISILRNQAAFIRD